MGIIITVSGTRLVPEEKVWKFLFIGVCIVCRQFGSEWYSRNMYIQGSPEYEHHIKTYGKHSEFGYKDFIPMFKAEKFDPDAWASLFEEAGAQYVVPVAEHHDGFQMYKSEISHWNAYEMGPKRDVLGELGRSCNQKMECAWGHLHTVLSIGFFMSLEKSLKVTLRNLWSAVISIGRQ